jgi:hypothetical protein
MDLRVVTWVAALVITACAPAVEASASLEDWCATQPADRCVEGVILIHDAPAQQACVLGSRSDLPLWDQCGAMPNPNNTATTIPPPGVDPAEAQRRQFIEQQLPQLDARIVEVLTTANPGTPVTTGIVVKEPMLVPEIEDLVEGLGATWVSAWRTDFICVPGFSGQLVPDRFAYLDGVARAAAARLSADQSEAPVTGRFLLEAMWDGMEQAAVALRKPGVMVEAMEVALPVQNLATLADHPLISRVRIALNPEEAGDLSELAPLDCPPG